MGQLFGAYAGEMARRWPSTRYAALPIAGRLAAPENGTVFAVDRDDPCPRVGGQAMTSGPATTSVSLLANAMRLPAARAAQVLAQTGTADNGRHDESISEPGDGFPRAPVQFDQDLHSPRQRPPPVGRPVAVGRHDPAGRTAVGLLLEQIEAAVSRSRRPQAAPARVNHLERAAADAPGGTEYGDISDRFVS